MINITATANSTAPPPYPVARPHSSDTSPLTAILCLVALITIPMILYAFFVALMKCPRNPFRWAPATPRAEVSCKADRLELVCGVKYRKAAEDGRKEAAESSDQCPVCLSAFAEGEEIRQLSACKHAFHAACVDMWLYSHSNCPVCRAAVPVRRSKRVSIHREDDFQQGLPDAANLI
ncbi:RING-H2 finger protein ATL33 [Sesamum indicum]|uniref:RING-H2 finger protein ATL33 n=1 Tax=Sesamum indicum TaxID=4182 RepID=A0A6I9U6E1_SESIN|nr:RING-H2 finger protein ATL33 [Sesamum indicum]